jgi:broad specificity phosphatase PhoE
MIKNPNKYQAGKTIVYFVRHGDRIHIPGTPPPHDFSLSAKGKRQAKAIAYKFAKIKGEIDVLYSSPMKRAYETAVEIGKQIGKKPVILKGFEEIENNFEHPKIFSLDYWKAKREIKKKQEILDKILDKNRKKVIVIVAHGMLNKILLGRKLGLSYKSSSVFDAHNCHISLVRFKGKKLDYIHCINSPDIVDITE